MLGLSYIIFNSINFSCRKHNRVGDDVEANQNAVEEAEEACEEQNGIENPHAVDFNDIGEMEED